MFDDVRYDTDSLTRDNHFVSCYPLPFHLTQFSPTLPIYSTSMCYFMHFFK